LDEGSKPFLKNDQHALVAKHILSATVQEGPTRDNLGLLAGDILLTSIIFSAKHTTALALEIILREQPNTKQVFLLLKICGIESQRHLYQFQNPGISAIAPRGSLWPRFPL
jgi:hypothetical protein